MTSGDRSSPGSFPGSFPGSWQGSTPGPADEDDAHRAPRIGYVGKRLGRFYIAAEVGRGGMATVYRAHDQALGRDVAVKVMHGFFAGRPELEARFRREANAVAAIRHPSILAVYDFVPPAGEEPGYIVSELIAGPGLTAVAEARRGRLLPEVVMLLSVRVADALGAAHGAGIVHRDVKPDNVLIDRAGGGARVVLTDFGVAHVGGLDTMTATGAVLGSPAYMSPEQARGDDVSPQSDVFALGVLMYQLATGHLPFTGKDPLAVIAAILRGEYTRPAKLEARIAPELEQVIVRCLQRDPALRFPDGAAVAAALRAELGRAALGDEEAALRRYLGDPDGFERNVGPAVAAQALAAAEEAKRRRQIPRALAEVGRALAYAPDLEAAQALLARLGSRARVSWRRAGVALAALAAAGVAAFVVLGPGGRGRGRGREREQPVPAPAALAPPGTPVRAAAVPAPVPAVAAALDSAAAARTAVAASAPSVASLGPAADPAARAGQNVGRPVPHVAIARPPAGREARGPGGTRPTPSKPAGPSPSAPIMPPANRAAATEPGAPAATEEATPDRAPAAPAVAAPAPAAAAPPVAAPAPANLILRASHGFCEPSLDNHPPSLRASYSNVAPGPHEIFCTMPRAEGKEPFKAHVATYDLRPGTRTSLIIVPDAEGRPVLGRLE